MGEAFMDWGSRTCVLVAILIATSVCAPAAGAISLSAYPNVGANSFLHKVADTGVSIVRMPQRPSTGRPSTIPATQTTPAPAPRTSESVQPQGRLLKLQVKLSSQPNDAQKGYLGVEMENLELPLALSLGLPNADGAFLLKAVAGSPAAQAGIRFGDIIVGLAGRAVANMSDLRQRISSIPPGTEAVFEVWRAASDDGDFLQVMRKLADSGNTHVMYRLGRVYAAGTGVARDEAEAVRWYRRAADAGNVNATSALAVALIEGRAPALTSPRA